MVLFRRFAEGDKVEIKLRGPHKLVGYRRDVPVNEIREENVTIDFGFNAGTPPLGIILGEPGWTNTIFSSGRKASTVGAHPPQYLVIYNSWTLSLDATHLQKPGQRPDDWVVHLALWLLRQRGYFVTPHHTAA